MRKGGGMTQPPGGPSKESSWIETLTRVGESREESKKSSEHRSIYSIGGHNVTLAKYHEAKKIDKLSVVEIVEISKKELANLRDQLSKGTLSIDKYKELTKKTIDLTREIINRREAKMNALPTQLLRLVGYVISAAASVFLVGIPFFYKLIRDDLKFQNEIRSLKNTLKREEKRALRRNAEVEFEKDMKVEFKPNIEKVKEIDLEVIQKIIPDIMGSEKIATNEYISGEITFTLNKNVPKHKDDLYTTQFEKDTTRDISFIRKDGEFKDEQPLPPLLDFSKIPKELSKEQRDESVKRMKNERLNQAVDLIDKLVENETWEDQKTWRIAIQSVANQTNLNNLFEETIGNFLVHAVENNIVNWTDSKGSHILEAMFPDKKPPIQIEVIRNSENKIQEVKISVTGSLNIVKTTGKDTKEPREEVIVPDAFKGELTFSITLDETRNPVVSNVHSSLTSRFA